MQRLPFFSAAVSSSPVVGLLTSNHCSVEQLPVAAATPRPPACALLRPGGRRAAPPIPHCQHAQRTEHPPPPPARRRRPPVRTARPPRTAAWGGLPKLRSATVHGGGLPPKEDSTPKPKCDDPPQACTAARGRAGAPARCRGRSGQPSQRAPHARAAPTAQQLPPTHPCEQRSPKYQEGVLRKRPPPTPLPLPVPTHLAPPIKPLSKHLLLRCPAQAAGGTFRCALPHMPPTPAAAALRAGFAGCVRGSKGTPGAAAGRAGRCGAAAARPPVRRPPRAPRAWLLPLQARGTRVCGCAAQPRGLCRARAAATPAAIRARPGAHTGAGGAHPPTTPTYTGHEYKG
jgi:hypothetical protein